MAKLSAASIHDLPQSSRALAIAVGRGTDNMIE
jgi:hypothetical protein